jgi:hypothetical protein
MFKLIKRGGNMFYSDKVVLVTGGANGIGREITKAYCEKGAKVIIADNDKENGLKTETELRSKGYDVLFYNIDLKAPLEIEEMFKFIIKKYGKINILINNAGIGRFKSLYEMTVNDWDEVINTNLRGTFIASREFAKYNKNTKYGRIINIASTRYLMSEPNTEAYSASKGGIVALTHALAITLSKENITVNCISPGWIETGNYEELRPIDHEQHPSLRVGKPEDVARICLFLSDKDNDFINGENIVVDGGMTKKMIYIE